MKTIYQEGSETLRHYSNYIKELRRLVIVQGFVIITASSFLIKDESYIISGCVAFFGFIFTIALSIQLKNEMDDFESVLYSVINVENKLICEDGSLNDNNKGNEKKLIDEIGIWNNYSKDRKKRFENEFFKFWVLRGPSFIIGITFLAIIYVSYVSYNDKKPNYDKQVIEIIVPKGSVIKK